MYLKHLTLSAFRGVGSNLDLPFAKRTIIFGPNGSGKTSVLQAIPWAIYGKLPILSGTVYTREDALVNDFLAGSSAEVTLTFSDDVTISRTRRKQSSTTRGDNPLNLFLPVDDAQVAVENLVGLNLDEFFGGISIRDYPTPSPRLQRKEGHH
jgi:DNA repair exonuclease SbcCD ATPase subunit